MTEELPIAEVYRRFTGEWVVVEVTAETQTGQTARGRVVAHGKDRQEIGDAEIAFPETRPGDSPPSQGWRCR